jgi:cytochrome P450
MLEMTLIVATVLQRVRLSLAPGQSDPEPLALFSLRPQGGLKMQVEFR